MAAWRRSARNGGERGVAARLLTALLLLPFVVFSLIQPDTMLAADAQGRMMVVLCGDDMPVEMAVAADGTMTPVSELEKHQPADRHATCAWAPHGQPLLGGTLAAMPLPHLSQIALDLAPSRQAGARLLPQPVPVARGPPAIA